MTIKKKLFFVFAAIILLVPVYVAVSSQNVLNNRTFYKFKPMAYDPFDPFRGKFLSVNYSTDFVPTKFDFDEDETVYVSIGVDNEGFAFFEEAFKSPPKKKDYLKTVIRESRLVRSLEREIEAAIEQGDFDPSMIDTRSNVSIKIPDNMNKYFINEDDALKAETVFREEQENIYIGVRVLNGEVRLDNIFVYDQPILDYIESKRK